MKRMTGMISFSLPSDLRVRTWIGIADIIGRMILFLYFAVANNFKVGWKIY